MNKVSKIALWASLLSSAGLFMTGCDWGSPDEGEYWSDTYNWINFSGVYKNPAGGPVVTDFSFTGGSTNTALGPAIAVGPVTIASGNDGSTYSSTTAGALLPNIVPGSLQITAGGVVFTDDGAGNLDPSSGMATMSGSVSYNSGAWNINLGGVIIPSGQPITAKYSVYQTSGTGGATITGTADKFHGTSLVTIYSLTVIQEGQFLTIIDSDGKSYSGNFGSVRSVSGELGVTPREGDTVVGQFSVKGFSRVGMPVEMVGVFQGTISTEGAGTYVMVARSIQGQWVEKGSAGKTGDIVGAAKDAAINFVNEGTITIDHSPGTP